MLLIWPNLLRWEHLEGGAPEHRSATVEGCEERHPGTGHAAGMCELHETRSGRGALVMR